MRPPVRTLSSVLLLALGSAVLGVLGLLGAGPALAHNGTGAAFTGSAGPFEVFAYDGRPAATAGLVEYRVVLSQGPAQTPVNDATVTITASGPSAHGPERARDVANIYYFELPEPGPLPYKITLAVSKGDQTGSVSFDLHGVTSTARDPLALPTGAAPAGPTATGRNTTAIVVGAGGLLVLALLAARGMALARRRASGDAAPGRAAR